MMINPVHNNVVVPTNGNTGIVPPWLRDDFWILPVPGPANKVEPTLWDPTNPVLPDDPDVPTIMN